MRNLIKTIALATFCLLASVSFAAGNHGTGGHGHDHGNNFNLGEKQTKNWAVTVYQEGKLAADSTDFGYTVVIKSNGGQLADIEAVRIWMGDAESDSLVNRVSLKKTSEAISSHSHLTIEQGDDRSQFTLEIDLGDDEPELVTFKTV